VIALSEVAMPVQALILKADFAHRINGNGTVDSICLHCFGTVASLPMEIHLEQQEAAHACWQLVESTEMKSAAEGSRLVAFSMQKSAPDESRSM
jgi:hypothetical protein